MQLKHLARALNISASMCSRLAKRGMPTDTIARAQRWRRRHLDLARTKGARMAAGGDASAPSAAGAGIEADDEPTGDDASLEYREARAEREQLRVQRERIELEQLQGNLVDVREVATFEFTAARITRDRMEMVAPRFTAEIHARLLALVPAAHREVVAAGLDLHSIEQLLSTAVRDALGEAAKAIEESREGDEHDD